jgi:hypothetical protein
MTNKFIELPVFEYPYRNFSMVSNQFINIDWIVRAYTSDSREYENNTFIELNRKSNACEPIRIALPYNEVVRLIKIA